MRFKALTLTLTLPLTLTLLACGDKGSIAPNASFADLPKLPSDQVIVGFQQYMTEAGKNKATVLGDTAFMFDDSAMVRVKGVRMKLFDENGRLNATVTSRSGDLYTQTQRMMARGNVVLTTSDGQTIESEEINYDPTTHRIWSDKPTTQRMANGGVARGSSFDADDKFVNVRITNASSRGGGLKIQF